MKTSSALLLATLCLAACASGAEGSRTLTHETGMQVAYAWSPARSFVSDRQIVATGITRPVRVLGRRGAAQLAEQQLSAEICGAPGRLSIDTQGLFVEETRDRYIYRMYTCGA